MRKSDTRKVIGMFTALIMLVSIAMATAVTGQTQATSKAEFKFETESHDFGKLKRGKPAKHVFEFTNIGSEPIIITEVRSSCGCSVPAFSKTPVKPGETGKIEVTFDAEARGPFTKHLTVRSNTKTPVRTLVIRGEVVD